MRHTGKIIHWLWYPDRPGRGTIGLDNSDDRIDVDAADCEDNGALIGVGQRCEFTIDHGHAVDVVLLNGSRERAEKVSQDG